VTGLPASAFTTPHASDATGERGWLQAMLDVERALAVAAGQVGLVSTAAARSVADVCRPESFDVARIADSLVAEATPVVELVRQLRTLVPDDARSAVHLAATSQDVVDTAMVLVVRRALVGVDRDVAAIADLLAGLARTHRDAVQVGRTLLQDGAVTTFGAALASRLVAVAEARQRLSAVVRGRLVLQLGGGVGTLAGTGDLAVDYLEAVARALDLDAPVVPWHTSRGRVAELVCACAVLAGELAAAAQDVVLLSQSSVAEVAVAHPGTSSAMPHKRNPAPAVLALACAHRLPGLVATILAGMPQPLQRSYGSWQAEWAVVTDVLQLLAATAMHTRSALDGLHVDTARMAANAASLGGTGDPGAAGTFVDRALVAHDRAAPDAGTVPAPSPDGGAR
jgi:3-carboxy-cis,cis-muconate cycloisomerase